MWSMTHYSGTWSLGRASEKRVGVKKTNIQEFKEMPNFAGASKDNFPVVDLNLWGS